MNMTMKEFFEVFMEQESVKTKMQNNPVYKATVLAFYNFFRKGGKLSDISWFALCGKESEEKETMLNKAA